MVYSPFLEEFSEDFSCVLGSIVGDHSSSTAKSCYYFLIQCFCDNFSGWFTNGAALYPFSKSSLKTG